MKMINLTNNNLMFYKENIPILYKLIMNYLFTLILLFIIIILLIIALKYLVSSENTLIFKPKIPLNNGLVSQESERNCIKNHQN